MTTERNPFEEILKNQRDFGRKARAAMRMAIFYRIMFWVSLTVGIGCFVALLIKYIG